MTEVLTLDPPPPGAAACTNCGAPLHGPFCAACGQEVKPLDPPVHYFLRDFVQELLDVDGRIFRSLRALVFSPGLLTVEHVAGRRMRWLSPLKLYLLTSVAAFTVLAFAGGDAGLRIQLLPGKGEAPSEVWPQSLGFRSAQELGDAIATARQTWIPRVMFVIVPFFAWLVARVRRRAGRHYPAHLVFALHVHAAVFAVRAVASALGLVLPAALLPWLDALVLAYGVGYLYLAFRTVYDGGRLRAARDLMLVGMVHWVAVLLVTGLAVIWATLGTERLWAVVRAMWK